MTQRALVNPDILSWARERARLSIENIARKLGTNPNNIMAWESGETKPTFKQAQTFAEKTYVPFGFLFLSTPPKESSPLPDLRTVKDFQMQNPSIDLLDVIRNVMQKQAWYLDHALEQGAKPLSFVGQYTFQSNIDDVVSDIRKTLKTQDIATKNLTWEQYQSTLIAAAEEAGILVMRSGIVANNTHRPLDVNEFRGFAISDQYAPIVFINSKDAPTARLFTLIHELAHLWIGRSGISSAGTKEDKTEERFCNAIAGEFLAPLRIVEQHWKQQENWQQNLPEIARKLHVSKLVVARKALELGKIDNQTYSDYYHKELQSFRDQEGGGGSFYRNAGTKNSHRFSKAVLSEALSGRMLLRDASNLLGIHPSKLKAYAKEFSL